MQVYKSTGVQRIATTLLLENALAVGRAVFKIRSGLAARGHHVHSIRIVKAA
jgi:hypothetical protein